MITGVLSVPRAKAPVLSANRPVPSIPTKTLRESAVFTIKREAELPVVVLYMFALEPVTFTFKIEVGFARPIPTLPDE
jgi:hypothetical protein